MNLHKSIYAFFATAFCMAPQLLKAQDQPIGYWQSHLCYNNDVSLATDGNVLYSATSQAFFSYNNSTGDINAYSKVDGMSDVGMQCLGYDVGTSTVILGYTNSNIDLFKDNTFYNIPDLKNKSVAGTKAINHIYTEAGTAYLSTSIGVLLIDLNKKVIPETYTFFVNNQNVPVNGFTGVQDYFYTITAAGLFRANKNNPELQNYQVWTRLDSVHSFTSLAVIGSNLFVANYDSLFVFKNDSLHFLYRPGSIIKHIDAQNNGLWITQSSGHMQKMDSLYNLTDSFYLTGIPLQTIELGDKSVWVADSANGLTKRGQSDHDQFFPNSPADVTSYDIYPYNKNVWVAHGTYTQLYLPSGNKHGISNLVNGKWVTYTQKNYKPFADANLTDFVSILRDEATGTVYAGSFYDGLFILNTDGSYSVLKDPPFDPSAPNGSSWYEIAGLALDQNDNLWVSMFGSPHSLNVKTKDSTWYKYQLYYTTSYPYAGGPMVIDDGGEKWYVSLYGGGIMVYNDNGTPADITDDVSKHLVSGAGYGNLPDNTTFCVAKDKNDEIWIGTANGIGIISCAGSYTQQPCDAEIRIVQYDQYAGYLFANEQVNTIAVDGANRKWVGTNNGVWLLSPDAQKIIYRFTQDNSPLPSNHIQKIAIDPVTGDVYIGTDLGLMCYKSTATDGGTTNQSVLTYPNPVPSGYTGQVAIKGLVANADVRITDISGQLVYKAIATGGQLVWGGVDYTGHRPESGVYLIFVTNTDGSQNYVGKMVFMQ